MMPVLKVTASSFAGGQYKPLNPYVQKEKVRPSVTVQESARTAERLCTRSRVSCRRPGLFFSSHGKERTILHGHCSRGLLHVCEAR